MKFAKGSEEWMLFTDLYALVQDVWGIENTEEYWEGVRKAVEAFASKYGPFGVGLSAAVLTELKRRSEEK
ncbi:MAG TPA: hypothetical protein IAB61_01770 [Candidatus Merdisoma merdipullorum]|nr:hypothetical protein [Candidatus Merdisoma merdipullorum]